MGPDIKVLDHKQLTFDNMEIMLANKDSNMENKKLIAVLEPALTALKEGKELSEDETTAIIDALGCFDEAEEEK
ncbi:MAG: hypothetical protein JSC189_000403 [Candidatus Tokpelaia sp. JSC189]|nr:MAG: hypothetical protein JSC189_000403 [Candidatus Tokpelaia sp. JSC189]